MTVPGNCKLRAWLDPRCVLPAGAGQLDLKLFIFVDEHLILVCQILKLVIFHYQSVLLIQILA
jgi:hypothetical protein